MNVIRCLKGHYYDSDKYEVCPHCGASGAVDTASQGENTGNPGDSVSDSGTSAVSNDNFQSAPAANFIDPNMNLQNDDDGGYPSTVTYGSSYENNTSQRAAQSGFQVQPLPDTAYEQYGDAAYQNNTAETGAASYQQSYQNQYQSNDTNYGNSAYQNQTVYGQQGQTAYQQNTQHTKENTSYQQSTQQTQGYTSYQQNSQQPHKPSFDEISSTVTLNSYQGPSLRQNLFTEYKDEDDAEAKTRYIKPDVDMDVTSVLTGDGMSSSGEQYKAVLIQTATGQRFGLSQEKTVIGKICSVRQSDICIKNNTVSRRHACITIIGDKYFIEDLGSTNKTRINGIDIGSNRMLELKDNDRVVLSDEEFIFYIT